jgi:hypothetical protein
MALAQVSYVAKAKIVSVSKLIFIRWLKPTAIIEKTN